MPERKGFLGKIVEVPQRSVNMERVFARSARLRRRRMALAVVTGGGAALALTFVVAGPWANSGRSPDPGFTGGPAAPSSSSQDRAGVCPYLDKAPTYLPWLEPGEIIPPPEKSRFPGEADSSLTWYGPSNDDKSPYYVTLRNDDRLHVDPSGKESGVRMDGVPGAYAAPEPRNGAITWAFVPAARCSLVTLELTTSGRMTAGEARGETIRVARSLVDASPR